ncbi:MAG: CotH kinase family protein [Saprospiraceae bacterium]|nr:CotH kinase family protein [Saprospiraceae bacterium]
MKKLILILLVLTSSSFAFGQRLPKEFYISSDGKKLQVGGQIHNGFYKEDVIHQIRITFTQANWWTLLTNNYAAKIDLSASVSVDGVKYDSVGVRFKGQTSYMGVSGTNSKKSFNISFDAFKDQKLSGYATLNLNNSFQDASFMREMLYYNTIRRHTVAAKCNYVHLFVNDIDFGVYQNVQQNNKDLLEEWYITNDGNNVRADVPPGSGGIGPGGGWGDGTAAFNYLADTNSYKKYYTLKSSDIKSVWPDFHNVTQILNQSPIANLKQNIEPYLDIDRTLWHLATEVLFADDDSYIYKGKMDYYYYQDAETWRFQTYDYDANSILSSNSAAAWSPFYNETKVNYPLLNKLLQVPEIRQRYVHHLKTLLSEYIESGHLSSRIDYFKGMVDSLVLADPKKLATYAQFTTAIPQLKNLVTIRANTIKANPAFQQIHPSIFNTQFATNGQVGTAPNKSQSALISTNVSHVDGIRAVNLYYGSGISGLFTKVAMYDDGLNGDAAANDGIFSASIPPFAPNSYVRYYIESFAANTSNAASYDPPGAEHDVYFYKVQADPLAPGVVTINEIMASNGTTFADNEGQFDDWIEFYNNSSDTIDLSGYKLSDNNTNLAKWTFPAGAKMPPNGFYIVWADEDSAQGDNHCNFKLSTSGESVILSSPTGTIIDQVDFSQQTLDQSYSRIPNGTGAFKIKTPTPGFNNESTSANPSLVTPLSFEIYPNPSNQWVTIVFTGNQNQYPVQIFNTMGELIYKDTLPQTTNLNAAEWPNGIYFIKCQHMIKKWIVQH